MELDLNKSFNGYRAYIMDTGAFADDGIYGRWQDIIGLNLWFVVCVMVVEYY